MEHMRVYARVDLDAIVNNIEEMKKRLKADTKIAVVIKADGYGHGSLPIAMELSDIPYIWGFCVATCEEAMELRIHGIKKPILILGYSFSEDYERLIKNDIRPTIFTTEMAKEYSEVAQRLNRDVSVHIKIDTGMGRIGFKPDEASAEEIARIFKLPHLHPEGIFTHFAKADESDLSATELQFEKFTAMIGYWRKIFRNAGLPFLFVQLPMWLDTGAEDSFTWARTRLAQAAVRDSVRNTGMACLLDEGEYGNIHPVNKQPVGLRLAGLAERMIYGENGEESPRALAKWTRGNVATVVLSGIVRTSDGEAPRLLEAAGEDGVFVPAEGETEEGVLRIRAAGVQHPVRVRYAWTDWSDRVNLFGENGLPLEPFEL